MGDALFFIISDEVNDDYHYVFSNIFWFISSFMCL